MKKQAQGRYLLNCRNYFAIGKQNRQASEANQQRQEQREAEGLPRLTEWQEYRVKQNREPRYATWHEITYVAFADMFKGFPSTRKHATKRLTALMIETEEHGYTTDRLAAALNLPQRLSPLEQQARAARRKTMKQMQYEGDRFHRHACEHGAEYLASLTGFPAASFELMRGRFTMPGSEIFHKEGPHAVFSYEHEGSVPIRFVLHCHVRDCKFKLSAHVIVFDHQLLHRVLSREFQSLPQLGAILCGEWGKSPKNTWNKPPKPLKRLAKK